MVSIGVISGKLELTDNFTSRLQLAETRVSAFANKFDKINASLTTFGTGLSIGLTAPIVALGTAATRTFMQFETAMKTVQAALTPTTAEFQRLQAAALEWGAKTQFSATQAAEALGELGKAGFSVEQSIGGLPSVLQLATVSGMGLADAATLTADTLTQFNLKVEDAASVNDKLTKAAQLSTIDVQQLGESLKFAGPVAAGFGISIGDTSAALAAFGNAGIKAEMAGSALRNILTDIVNPTKGMSDVMEKLGISTLKSADGTIKLADVIDKLKNSGATAGDVMKMFGDRAGPGMVALVSKGSDSLRELEKEIRNSDGAAKAAADTMMSGLGGALERLRGATETAGVSLGAVFAPAVMKVASVLEGLANFLTSTLIPAFQMMPTAVQAAVGGFVLLAAAAGPLLLALRSLILAAETLAGMKALGWVLVSLKSVSDALMLATLKTYAHELAMKASTAATYAWGAAQANGQAALLGLIGKLGLFTAALYGVYTTMEDAATETNVFKNKMTDLINPINLGITIFRQFKLMITDSTEAWKQMRASIEEPIKMPDLPGQPEIFDKKTKGDSSAQMVVFAEAAGRVRELLKPTRDFVVELGNVEKQLRSLDPAMRRQIIAAKEMGGDAIKDLIARTGLYAKTIDLVTAENKTAAKEFDKVADAAKEFADQLTGVTAIASAQKWLKAVEGGLRLTKDAAIDYADELFRGIRALEETGQTGTEAYRKLVDAYRTANQAAGELAATNLELDPTRFTANWRPEVLEKILVEPMKQGFVAMEALWDGIPKMIDPATAYMQRKMQEVKEFWASIFQDMRRTAVMDLSGAIVGLTSFEDAFTSMFDRIKEYGATIMDQLINGILDQLTEGGKGFMDAWNKIAGGGNKWAGMASAGIVGGTVGYGVGKKYGTAKGVLAGAGAGAMVGANPGLMAATGGASVVIGAGIGALAGWWGGRKKKKEQEKAMEEDRAALLEQFGGMNKLREAAEKVGISIDKAFTTKKPEEFGTIVGELTERLDRQATAWAGVEMAAQGVLTLAEGFQMTLDKSMEDQEKPFVDAYEKQLEALKKKKDSEAEVDALQQQFAEAQKNRIYVATDEQIKAYNNLGLYAGATIANMVGRTGDLVSAILAVGPAIETLKGAQENFGLAEQTSAATEQVLHLYDVVSKNEAIFTQLAGVGQIMTGLGDAFVKNSELVNAFGSDISSLIGQLEETGVSTEEAFAFAAPQLQELWETVKEGKIVVDDTTAALLNQAEAQGVVGDHMRDTNEQILDVLTEIRDMFASELPAAIARTGDAANTAGQTVEGAAQRAASAWDTSANSVSSAADRAGDSITGAYGAAVNSVAESAQRTGGIWDSSSAEISNAVSRSGESISGTYGEAAAVSAQHFSEAAQAAQDAAIRAGEAWMVSSSGMTSSTQLARDAMIAAYEAAAAGAAYAAEASAAAAEQTSGAWNSSLSTVSNTAVLTGQAITGAYLGAAGSVAESAERTTSIWDNSSVIISNAAVRAGEAITGAYVDAAGNVVASAEQTSGVWNVTSNVIASAATHTGEVITESYTSAADSAASAALKTGGIWDSTGQKIAKGTEKTTAEMQDAYDTMYKEMARIALQTATEAILASEKLTNAQKQDMLEQLLASEAAAQGMDDAFNLAVNNVITKLDEIPQDFPINVEWNVPELDLPTPPTLHIPTAYDPPRSEPTPGRTNTPSRPTRVPEPEPPPPPPAPNNDVFREGAAIQQRGWDNVATMNAEGRGEQTIIIEQDGQAQLRFQAENLGSYVRLRAGTAVQGV